MRFDYCPKRWVQELDFETHQLYEDYLNWKRFKTLPRAGGFADQCPRFVDSVWILEAALNAKDK